MNLNKCKTDCIFYGVYHDHGASVPFCGFNCECNLSADIDRLIKECPCRYYTTLKEVRDVLLADGRFAEK